MTKLDRYLLLVSYLLLMIIVLWMSIFFVARSDKAQEQRCTTTLLGIEIQSALADYTIDVLGGDRDPTDDAENQARRDAINQTRAEIAALCEVPVEDVPSAPDTNTR